MPSACGREGQRNRRQVGRERRPWAIVDLGDRITHVVSHRQSLIRGNQEIAALDQALQAKALELAPDHQQVVGLDVADPQVPTGCGGERHEAADLDVVRADLVIGSTQPVPAVHGQHVGADPVHPCAHLCQQMPQVLDVRLAGRICDHGLARGQRRREHCVLGAHH